MCLRLSKNWKEKTEKFRSSGEKITGYKIMQKEQATGTLKSVYQQYLYGNEGDIVVSDRLELEITEEETSNLEITNGLHFFKRIEETYLCLSCVCPKIPPDRQMCQIWDHSCNVTNRYNAFFWVEFEINPEDLTAIGDFWGLDSFVAHKAKIVQPYYL